jgi:hypothetical protein
MAIICKLKLRGWVGKKFKRKQMKKLKRIAHRRYRHAAKQAINAEREIDEKPRLTSWDII